MRYRFKFILSFIILLTGFMFIPDAKAESKICNYFIQYDGSSHQIKVSYNDKQLCYYVNSTGGCITAQSSRSGSSRASAISQNVEVYNTIPIDAWHNDSDGCIELYFAKGTGTASGTSATTIYGFSANSDNIEIGYHVTKTPKITAFQGSKDTVRVTFDLVEGADVYVDVEVGGTVDEPETPLYYDGKNFKFWRVRGENGRYEFTRPVITDITIYPVYIDAPGAQTTGFLNISNQEISCGDVTIPYGLPYIISRIIKLLKLATPIILVFMGTLDFVKAVIAHDEKEMQQKGSVFIRRVIAAVVVFLVISIVQLAFNFLGDEGNEVFGCFDCFISGGCDPEPIAEES